MKKITHLWLIALTLNMILCSNNLIAQETQTAVQQPTITLSDQVTMKIGGFLRADVFTDTHKNAEILDGLLDLYPLNKSLDANTGKDINSLNLFRMSAASSRLNAKFTGPDVFNAKSTSLIEFDFTGVNGYGLRLRHAWIKLNWQNSEFLFGRYWHPMFITDAFPTVLGLNTGAPFIVFNRCEQMRYTYNIGSISIMAAASIQMDYGLSSEFNKDNGVTTLLHNQIMPDLTLNTQFKNDMFLLGISGNYKVDQPRISTTGKASKSYQTSEKINSFSAQIYGQIKAGNFKIKGGALYGQNMIELLMLGGFAVSEKDTALTNHEKYTTVNNLNYWGNILYGDKLQVGLFVGYIQNLGTTSKNVFEFTSTSARGYDAKGTGIDHLIRIAPSVSYKTGRLQFYLELEQSIVAYGSYKDPITKAIYEHALVKNTTNVMNTRANFATIFYF